MRKGWMMAGLLGAALLTGCTLGADRPEAGMTGRIKEVQRDLGTQLVVEAQHRLQSGEEMAVVSYKKGSTCGTGLLFMQSVVSMEGECNAPLSPAQSSDNGFLTAYGYMVPGSVARVVLRWEDGTEAEAKLGKEAFYYIAEGDNLPEGQVSLTAYDRDGKVILILAPPAQHKH